MQSNSENKTASNAFGSGRAKDRDNERAIAENDKTGRDGKFQIGRAALAEQVRIDWGSQPALIGAATARSIVRELES